MKKYMVTLDRIKDPMLPINEVAIVRADYYRIRDGDLSFYTHIDGEAFKSFASGQWVKVEIKD